MRPHSIWGQNKIWFFKSQSIYLNERAFLHLPSRLFFSLSFSYFQRLPSFLWLARGMYILWGFFPLHQWLKTQQAVNFVPVAVTLGNRTCLSPSLTFPHFVQGRTLLRAPAVTLVWSGAAVAGFLKLCTWSHELPESCSQHCLGGDSSEEVVEDFLKKKYLHGFTVVMW